MDLLQNLGQDFQGPALDELGVNTLRTLAMDAVQKANSGHPGLPMGCADFAYVLWTEFLKFDPAAPDWPDRDRFVLSAGHGSMLLYGLLHLAGFDLPLEELKRFRQWESRTPGHPEYRIAPGVECTTGPLGQGVGNAVGMAIAEAWLAARFNSEALRPVDHLTYVLCSDGDLEEGVAAEAVSLAGHLGLGKLIMFYDSNRVSIEGDTALAYSDDVKARFRGYHWHVQEVDGHDRAAIRRALRRARRVADRPSLIIGATTIAYGSPNKAGSAAAHGSPLGEEEIRLTKRVYGWPEEGAFLVPEVVRQRFARAAGRGRRARRRWERLMGRYRQADPERAAQWERAWSGRLPEGLEAALPRFEAGKGVATRVSAGKTQEALMKALPNLIGGSADLAPSTNTYVKEHGSFSRTHRAGRNFHFGVREHGMGAALNGMCCHGGVRPFGATFLVFSDYMRPSIRLAALSRLNPIYVFTHDSIFLGEDGPTHQPVEHLAALRAIPNLAVIRPADAAESAWAWLAALRRTDGPTALCLTRQAVPTLDRTRLAAAEGLLRGGYLLVGEGDLTLLATGSEVAVALAARDRLEAQGIRVRVVSLPSIELFEAQEEAYRRQVLGGPRRVAVEAGIRQPWDRYLGPEGLFIGVERFGASAPWETLAERFGLTAGQVAERVGAWWGGGGRGGG